MAKLRPWKPTKADNNVTSTNIQSVGFRRPCSCSDQPDACITQLVMNKGVLKGEQRTGRGGGGGGGAKKACDE